MGDSIGPAAVLPLSAVAAVIGHQFVQPGS
jgi:hypothetical protein